MTLEPYQDKGFQTHCFPDHPTLRSEDDHLSIPEIDCRPECTIRAHGPREKPGAARPSPAWMPLKRFWILKAFLCYVNTWIIDSRSGGRKRSWKNTG